MTFGFTAATWVAIGSTAVAAASSEQQRKAGSQARTQATINAKETARLADEANNRANAKAPDTAAAMAAAMLSGKAGNSGTMLTGSQGIDPAVLSLGRNNLLGS